MTIASPSLVHTSETSRSKITQATLRPSAAKSQVTRQASAIELYECLESDPESKYFYAESSPRPSRSDQLRKCRKTGFYGRHKKTGMVRIYLDGCKNKWCSLCGSALVSWRTHAVSDWLGHCYRPRFATFTVEHTDDELRLQVKNLNRYFCSLRKSENFHKNVRGGIWFPHFKRSSGDGLWHPHMHTVLSGYFYPQSELSSDWKRASRGSTVVDIRKIANPDKAANEVARYSANPCDLSKLSLEDRVTVYHALHGRRGCGSWGSAKGIPLKLPKSDNFSMIENIGSICAIREEHDSDPNARAIFDAEVNQTYLEPGIHIIYTGEIVEVDGFYRRAI